MKTREVIETVLGTTGRIKILRRLEQAPQPLSGRQVAELTGLTHRGATQAIAPLIKAGVVRERKVGRAHQYSLQKDNIIARDIILPALAAERHLRAAVEDDVTTLFAKDTVSLLMFGSYARGDETWQSDVDILAITSTAAKKSDVERLAESAAATFRNKYGAMLSVHILSLNELRRKKQPTFMAQAVKDGILLYGANPKDLVEEHG